MSTEELKQMMREWEACYIRKDIYDRKDPRAIAARSAITRLSVSFADLGFSIGHSDFGRLQLTLMEGK